jgi:hypothetical protein
MSQLISIIFVITDEEYFSILDQLNLTSEVGLTNLLNIYVVSRTEIEVEIGGLNLNLSSLVSSTNRDLCAPNGCLTKFSWISAYLKGSITLFEIHNKLPILHGIQGERPLSSNDINSLNSSWG